MTKAEAKKIVKEDFTNRAPVKELLLDLIERTHREAPRAKKKAPKKTARKASAGAPRPQ